MSGAECVRLLSLSQALDRGPLNDRAERQDAVETLRDAIDEIERLRKELTEMEMSIPLLIDGARKPLMQEVERLRTIIKLNSVARKTLMQEVERLRALIIEWADADDAIHLDFYPSDDAYTNAVDALRKAVGR